MKIHILTKKSRKSSERRIINHKNTQISEQMISGKLYEQSKKLNKGTEIIKKTQIEILESNNNNMIEFKILTDSFNNLSSQAKNK